jgi:chemotaxis protein MotB
MMEGQSSEEAATRVRSSSSPEVPVKRRGSFLPWLLVLLLGAGLATLVMKGMEARTELDRSLASARDESAELRRQLLLTQDRAMKAEKAHKDEAAKSFALQAKSSENDKLINDLRSQLDSKDGDVEVDQNRVRVNLVDQILFKSGDAEISPRGKKVLDKVGTVLKTLADKQILIGGHTDDRPIHTPQFPSNWELSSARAVNVVHYLAETVGVDAAKLTAAGYGEYHPRSKRDKAKNRRIEILLTPAVEVAKN